jgi:hypothetical protein
MTRDEAARLYATTLLAAGYTRDRGARQPYRWLRPGGTRAYGGDLNGFLFTTLPAEACGHLVKHYTWRLVAEAADA